MAGVRLPAHLFGVESSGVLEGGATLFLCRDFTVSYDLGSFCWVFRCGFDQFGNVFQELVELVACHFVHILTSFQKRLSPLPYGLMISHTQEYVNPYFHDFSIFGISHKRSTAVLCILLRGGGDAWDILERKNGDTLINRCF